MVIETGSSLYKYLNSDEINAQIVLEYYTVVIQRASILVGKRCVKKLAPKRRWRQAMPHNGPMRIYGAKLLYANINTKI